MRVNPAPRLCSLRESERGLYLVRPLIIQTTNMRLCVAVCACVCVVLFLYGHPERTVLMNFESIIARANSRADIRAGRSLFWADKRYISLSVMITAFFRIEFWPAWLSRRMRLSSPDHSPLIARTRVLAICSFSSYNTASGRFYQPGETFMTHLTYSGLCCFFFTERIDERYIKAPIAASKCRPTTSEVAWVFSGR